MIIFQRNPVLPRFAAQILFVFAAFSAAVPLWSIAGGFPREDISLSLREKVIQDLSSSGLTLAFHINVTNGAASDRKLVRYRYRVIINQREFLNMSVSLDEPLSLPGGRDTLIALPVKISYALLFEAVGPIEEKALCDIVGDMFFTDDRKREERAGFAFPGEFPIFKDPEVDFLPVKVNDLTVGGADLVFRPRFSRSRAGAHAVHRHRDHPPAATQVRPEKRAGVPLRGSPFIAHFAFPPRGHAASGRAHSSTSR